MYNIVLKKQKEAAIERNKHCCTNIVKIFYFPLELSFDHILVGSITLELTS